MEISLLIVLGLAVGSFLNVLIYRLNTQDKVPKFWQGRSFCPKCKHALAWIDNIPLFSFAALGGLCRHCRTHISWQYPIVELVTAICFIFIGLNPPSLLLAAVFIVIFFSDWIYGLIPDEMIITGSIVAAVFSFQFSVFSNFSFEHWLLIENWKLVIGNLGLNLLTGLLSASAFLFIVVVTKFRGMGLGDVKLAFLMGLLLGWPNVLVAFWSAFILGGIVAVALLVLKRTKLSATIPLGPFLVFGTLVSALWSTQMLHLLGF